MPTLHLVLLLAAVPGVHAQQAPAAPPGPGTAPLRTEKGLYLLRVVEPGYDVTVTETAREANGSTLDVRGVVPTITAGATVLFRAAYAIATERHAEYVFIIPAGPERRSGLGERGSEGRQLSMVLKVFITSGPKTPLKELLGPDYSAEAQQQFDQHGYMPVAQLALMFGGRGR